MNQVSSIQSNKLLTDSYISNCTLDISSITNNTLTEGTILRSSFNAQSIIDSNNINEGNIDGIQGSSCNIIDNSLSFSQMINISLFDSDISSNSLDSGSNITYSSLRNNSSIDNNVLIINCSFNNNDMTSTSITAISMSASSIEYNLMKNSYFSFTGIKTLSKISKINISDSVINNINIATSSIIYATHSRNVFSRQDGVVKISYYNNSDVLVIGNIND